MKVYLKDLSLHCASAIYPFLVFLLKAEHVNLATIVYHVHERPLDATLLNEL